MKIGRLEIIWHKKADKIDRLIWQTEQNTLAIDNITKILDNITKR